MSLSQSSPYMKHHRLLQPHHKAFSDGLDPGAIDLPIVRDSNCYDFVHDISSGNFGIARLMRDRLTGGLVTVKYIERGEKIDDNVEREIINHRFLRHPNIVKFKEVVLTPKHLVIVMEYAAGGEPLSEFVMEGTLVKKSIVTSFSS